MTESAKKTRILEFDIIRVLAMFWVVTYHFGCEYGLPFSVGTAPILNVFCLTPNFDFGNVAVTMFLVLSGALLYGKYGENTGNIFEFYKKRFKTIYPPFWILNLYVVAAMLRHWLSDGNPFFAGNPLKLLLTVTGFDGYVRLFGFENYYFCGEWFVGAIVLLYLLFPVLTWIYRKKRTVLLALLLILYGLQFMLPNGEELTISALPVTLVLKFVLGFLLMDLLPRLRNRGVAWVALIVFTGLCFLQDFPLPILRNDLLGSFAGMAVFLMVLNFCSGVRIDSPMGKIVQKLAPYTYCVFLLQHICISWLQIGFVKVLGKNAAEFSPVICMGLLATTLFVTIVAAYALKLISDKAVKFAESKFLS